MQESYHVPHLGLAAAFKNTPVVDNLDMFFGVKIPGIFDPNSNVGVNATQNFMFQGNDFMSVVSRLNFGTPLPRFDLAQPDIKLSTSLSKRDGVHVLERRDGVFARR